MAEYDSLIPEQCEWVDVARVLKVVVIGIGKMGLLHASILNAIPNVELVAFCDKSFLIRKFLKKVFPKILITKNIKEISKVRPDAIYVTTPIPSHYNIVKDVYSENIAQNLFVEKTLSSNFSQAKELCNLASNSSGVNMVGYMRRFAVTFQKAKKLIDERAIGDLIFFRAYAYSSDFYGIGHNSKIQTCSVGVVRDLGCHALDLALWLFGDLEVKNAKVKSLIDNGVEDYAYVEAEASRGLHGEFTFSWCVNKYRIPEVGFEIQGSEGTLSVNDDKLELILNDGRRYKWFRHDLKDAVDFWLGGPEYFREDEHFVKALVRNCAAEPDFQTAAKVDRVIDDIISKAC